MVVVVVNRANYINLDDFFEPIVLKISHHDKKKERRKQTVRI
jgi:hypothetical protein